MSRFVAKFGFIHRRLWQQDGLYKIALLFGPAPLAGCLMAAMAWVTFGTQNSTPHQAIPWAVPQGPELWNSAKDQPHIVEATKPLPATATDGALTGYEMGWRVATAPIQLSPALDVDVKTTRLTGFVVNGPSIDMQQIIAGGPKGGLYVGIGSGLLVVKTAGVYALSMRLDRPAGQEANCLTRLGFGSHRVISNVELRMTDDVSKTFDATRFDLQPGLFAIGWAFGCWHGPEETAPGKMSVLIGHPGEPTLQVARPEEIVRPVSAPP